MGGVNESCLLCSFTISLPDLFLFCFESVYHLVNTDIMSKSNPDFKLQHGVCVLMAEDVRLPASCDHREMFFFKLCFLNGQNWPTIYVSLINPK